MAAVTIYKTYNLTQTEKGTLTTLEMMTAAMKLKDAYSLEGKL